ncbi:MAG: hypothetical protein A3G84_05330 [Chloroflexi bacterium RIFCSPLOWO2_12_FULL_71_12]|nr:MAG: hypothetical protein A3G84_05330 [Chloroflexi bacterium RIFCSPLOWO2_12_FULL_71_12]
MASDVQEASELALEAVQLLTRVSAYDYALAGTLTGARTHIVSPDRYASVVRDSAVNIQRFTGKALEATLDTAGPIHERLVTLADALVEVSRAADQYADGGDPAIFAEVVDGVARGWDDVLALARLIRPEDPELLATIARGSSFAVQAKAAPAYGLTVGPFASSAEAQAAADRIGTVERVSSEAPFVVRVGTYADRAAGEAAVTALSVKGFSGLLAEEQRFTFSRSGPAPDDELWSEPESVFDTWGSARRVAVAPDAKWVVTGSDDGTIAVFTGDGVLRSLPRFHAGVAHLTFSDDGAWVMGGGITLVNFILPEGVGIGVPVRLPSPATQILYVPAANYFAAVAAADGEVVIAGRAPDGVPLGGPFPIRKPGNGGALAANGAGEMYFAWSESGATEIDVLNMAGDRQVQGVMRLPGTVSRLVVSRDGAHGAVMTDQGVYRFGPHAPDPSSTLKRIGDPVREIAIDAEGTLYLLTQTKITAFSGSGETLWSSQLVDGRRLVIAARPVVLDGAERLLTFSPSGDVEDLGTRGTVQDIAASPDGKRIAVLAEGRRAQIFKLP